MNYYNLTQLKCDIQNEEIQKNDLLKEALSLALNSFTTYSNTCLILLCMKVSTVESFQLLLLWPVFPYCWVYKKPGTDKLMAVIIFNASEVYLAR